MYEDAHLEMAYEDRFQSDWDIDADHRDDFCEWEELTVEDLGLDSTARYAVETYPGVAFRLTGVTGEDRVSAVMVGDDRTHDIGTDELTRLEEGAHCAGCGQIGCGHDGR